MNHQPLSLLLVNAHDGWRTGYEMEVRACLERDFPWTPVLSFSNIDEGGGGGGMDRDAKANEPTHISVLEQRGNSEARNAGQSVGDRPGRLKLERLAEDNGRMRVRKASKGMGSVPCVRCCTSRRRLRVFCWWIGGGVGACLLDIGAAGAVLERRTSDEC
jgi:hypothetical protein